MRKTATAVIAVVSALLGPRLSSPHDHAAGMPFAYDPPEGFAAAGPSLERVADGSKEWAHPINAGHAVASRVTLKELRKNGNVEPADLQLIADGMPAVLESSGVTWSTVRVETRKRADGTRVGLIEGESTKRTENLPGVGDVMLTYRRLMLVFPTDEGTALVTALYGKDELAEWQPVFENTINTAHGVALRVPPPPPWMNVAYGIAGAVLAWFGLSLLGRRQRGLTVPPPPPAGDEPSEAE